MWDAFWKWLSIFGIVVGLMSGLLSLFREFLGIYSPERLQRASLFWKCVWIAFIISSVSAWAAQYHRANEAEEKLDKLSKPKLVGVMDQLVAGDSPDMGAMQVFVIVSIKNEGAPSIAQAFHMRIKAGSFDATERPTFIPDGYKLLGEGGKIIAEFHDSDTWQSKAETPITQGVKIRAWLRFAFKGISITELNASKNRVREIYFKDINDQEYTITDKTLDTPGISFYPGSGTPFKH